MTRNVPLGERLFGLTGKALFSALMVCCLTETACPQTNPALSVYDVTPRQVTRIAPGTVIDRTAPPGWTHLIIKSQPRLGAGDLHKANDLMREMTALLFTCVTARVEQVPGGSSSRYRLADVGVGLGTRIHGRDTIVSSETQERLGARLGFIPGLILSEGEKRMQEVLIMARSETMILFDAPGILLVNGKHRSIILRYALLLDEQTGQVYPLVWPIDRDARGAYTGVMGPYEWFPPNKLEDCVIHLDGNEVSFAGIPSELAFAMVRFPQGQMQIPIPEAQKPLAGRSRLSRVMAEELEKNLRETLRQTIVR